MARLAISTMHTLVYRFRDTVRRARGDAKDADRRRETQDQSEDWRPASSQVT